MGMLIHIIICLIYLYYYCHAIFFCWYYWAFWHIMCVVSSCPHFHWRSTQSLPLFFSRYHIYYASDMAVCLFIHILSLIDILMPSSFIFPLIWNIMPHTGHTEPVTFWFLYITPSRHLRHISLPSTSYTHEMQKQNTSHITTIYKMSHMARKNAKNVKFSFCYREDVGSGVVAYRQYARPSETSVLSSTTSTPWKSAKRYKEKAKCKKQKAYREEREFLKSACAVAF